MIISHKNRFIFMHGEKTAGSSITIACNPHLGPRDVQVGIWPDVIKHGGHFNRKAKLILARQIPWLLAATAKHSLAQKRFASAFTVERANKEIRKHYRHVAKFGPDAAHPSAKQVRDYAPDAWDRYFKFTVVRNPWDHAVSYYYWKLRERGNPDVSFNEFLRRMNDWHRPDPEHIRPPRKSNFDIYTIGGHVVVDHIARFEYLANELATLSDKLGIPLDAKARAKAASKDGRKTLADHYDDECMALVRAIYQPEIDLLGYEPPF